jgi:hypothetical protein
MRTVRRNVHVGLWRAATKANAIIRPEVAAPRLIAIRQQPCTGF